MPYEKTHTKTLDGKVYDIAALIQRVGKRTPRLVLLPKADRSYRTGFSPARYALADTKYPILVLPDGTIIDGRHRVLKLQDAGETVTNSITVTPEDLKAVLLTPNAGVDRQEEAK
jgi:hypothetical protein